MFSITVIITLIMIIVVIGKWNKKLSRLIVMSPGKEPKPITFNKGHKSPATTRINPAIINTRGILFTYAI